jgi:formylglycine-generating enzyme required for sulfatase activity
MEGQTVNDFEIKRIIGEGSLGPVYLAEHKFIKKLFVLKFLPDSLYQNPLIKEKFIKEIAKIASLDHDNITSVHNVSSCGEKLFIVSDFIPYKLPVSMNLGEYLSTCSERLKEKEIVHILKEVAFALDYIHTQSFMKEPLFHGGVKLTNILLHQKKEGGYTLKLSDLGITTILGSEYILNLAMEKVVKGSKQEGGGHHQKRCFTHTFGFLAPEQRFNEANNPSYKSDIYAFGVLAYFLLMGHLPEGFFPLPSSVYKKSSIDWDRIVQAALMQHPSQRPDNLTALIQGSMDMTPLEEVVIPKMSPLTPQKDREEALVLSSENKSETKNSTEILKKGTQHLSLGSQVGELSSSISEFEKKLIGGLTATAVARPMKMQQTPITEKEELQNISLEPIFKGKSEVRSYKPEKIATDGIFPILTDTIEIKAGVYERGSESGARDEKPRHSVHLNTFKMDIHPVTNEQFLRFLLLMEGEKDDLNNDIILLRESRIKRHSGELTIETGYAKHPVVGVSYYGAKAYAEWVGRRLPTEAEWEVAASNGNVKNIFPFGDGIERSEANFFSADTTPVMSYPPSKNGLYDMVGNVYEWCEDWYEYSYYEVSALEPDNPKGPKQGVYRVLRGGCWKSLVDDMRCSHRFRNNPGTMNKTYGFRCVSQ